MADSRAIAALDTHPTEPDGQVAISYQGVDIAYRGNQGANLTVAVTGISFDVQKGSFTSVVGPSGCGKTSLLRLGAGFQEPTSGSVLCYGQPVRGLNHEVGYVTQQSKLYAWMTTRENVEFPLAARGVSPTEYHRRADVYLSMMGLADFADSYPFQLSGGMQKRAAIAQTLIYDPVIILMDEPFAGLDAQTRMAVEGDLLTMWEKLKPTIVFVTHDLAEAIALSDEVVVLSARPGRVKTIYRIPLERPRDVYTVQADPGFSSAYEYLWAQFHEADTLALSRPAPERQTRLETQSLALAGPSAARPEVSRERGLSSLVHRGLASRKTRIRLAQVGLLIVILALWETLADVHAVNPVIFSHPLGVLQQLATMLSGKQIQLAYIYPDLLTTFSEMAVGYAIGSAAAVVLGVTLARNRFVAQIIEPFILAWYGIPIITIAPIFVLLLGIGFNSKAGTAMFATFFVVFFQTYSGVKSLDEEQFLLARLMGASRLRLVRKILIPGSLPFVFIGLRMGVPVAMTGAIVGEFIASSSGLGAFILNASSSFDAGATFAALVLVVVIVTLCGLMVRLGEKALIRWRPTQG